MTSKFITLKTGKISPWSQLIIKKVDTTRIAKVNVRERAFCFFDKNHTYSLEIDYNIDDHSSRLLTVRYKSVDDIEKDTEKFFTKE